MITIIPPWCVTHATITALVRDTRNNTTLVRDTRNNNRLGA